MASEHRLLPPTMLYMSCLGSLAYLALATFSQSGKSSIDAHITVDLTKPLSAMPKTGLGLGVAVWDDHMMDKAVPPLLKAAGFSIIRYPGGSYADLYHWKTNSPSKNYPQATIRPNDGFDNFMKLVRSTKTTPLITVNYGSNPEGTGGAAPSEAAEWVRYANKVKGYGVRYWEIGNEVYGNGFYNGNGWEIDLHDPSALKHDERLKNPKLGPTAYGQNVCRFVDAMKAVDPSVQVGAVLCVPDEWPDRVTPDWNAAVLDACGSKIDFVVVHWYGRGQSAATLLDGPRAIPGKMDRLKADIAAHCGSRASHIKIWVTEGDASAFNTRPQGALFAADQFATWMESGAANMCWWDLHNGLGGPPGHEDDQGMLSNASRVRDVQEPPVNTPFPAYLGIVAFHVLAPQGARFFQVSSSEPTLRAHATIDRQGHLRIMIANDDQDHDSDVTLALQGAPRYGKAKRFDYLAGAASLTKNSFNRQPDGLTLHLPSNSLTVIEWERTR